MRGEIIHQIYIADGFDDDCDALIHRCLRAERLTYETFCEIWKDMKFDSLYIGRSSLVEIAELSEELIHTAKQYLMTKVTNFEETIAGLFLVYGLLSLQPYPGFAVLRLTPDDVPTIKNIEMIARREKRHDVLYILGAILIKHTQFHAEQRERGMEQAYRKYLDGYISIDRSGFRPRGTFYRQTDELDLIRELAAVTDRYVSAKQAVTGSGSDPSLAFINKSLPSELDSSLKRLISGIPGLVDDDEIDEADVHYSRVQAIKERAMKKAVGSMKFLTPAAERTTENSSKIVSEIKSKPGKVKSSSPIKTFSSPKKGDKAKSPRSKTKSPQTYGKSPKSLSGNTKASPQSLIAKASTSKPPMKRKMRRLKTKPKKSKAVVSESSSDSDIDLNYESDDDSDVNNDLDLDAFDKPNEKDNASEGMVEIEIENLPTHTTSEGDGRAYEIEIIDKLNINSGNSESQENRDGEKASSSTSKFKKPTARPKRPTLSLSRMGILPVPNFLDDKKSKVMEQTDSSTE